MKSVLLTGSKGAGKTTVGNILRDEFGYTQLALADPLRWEVAGMIASQRYSRGTVAWTMLADDLFRQMKQQGPTKDLLRGLLQWYGTDFRRAEDPLYWIKKTQAIIAEHLLLRKVWRFVIDDLSYANEAVAFGWPVVRIERPGVDVSDQHSSEVGRRSIPADLTICNDGTLDDLHGKAHEVALYLGAWSFEPVGVGR